MKIKLKLKVLKQDLVWNDSTYDFKKGYIFQDVDYRRLSYNELLNLCCN